MSEKQIYGNITLSYQPFFIQKLWLESQKNLLIVVANENHVLELYDQLQCIDPSIEVLAFQGWDCLPYDRVSPSQSVVTKRLEVLTALLHHSQKRYCVIVSVSTLIQRLPPGITFFGEFLSLQAGQNIKREVLIKYLTDKGYRHCETVYESGDYAVRGGIIDVFPTGCENPVRLDFFDEKLEGIKFFDPFNQRTVKICQKIDFNPIHEVSLTPDTIQNFRQGYRKFFGNEKEGVIKDVLYESVSNGKTYGGMEHWLPLFYDKCQTLIDYIEKPLIVMEDQVNQAFINQYQGIFHYYQGRLDPVVKDMNYRPLPPKELYWSQDEWNQFLETQEMVILSPYTLPQAQNVAIKFPADFTAIRQTQPEQLGKEVASQIKSYLTHGKTVVLTGWSEGSKQRLENILEPYLTIESLPSWNQKDLKFKNLYSTIAPFEKGFISQNLVLLTEQDIFGNRVIRKTSQKYKKNKVFQDVTQFNLGDFAVHREHGIGRYLGLQTLTINGKAHDCLCLEYEGNDKLFLPVENLDLITRYGDENSCVSLDRLGTATWKNKKEKVKKRLKVIADYLIQLAAERSLHDGAILEQVSPQFEHFCDQFPYQETEDQQKAIEETLDDLSSGKPMDRLICGDVGFGKTEVALRAAFRTVENGKQVAVIVPTTLLCRQHYLTFMERFKGSSFKIAQLSRLINSKEAATIKVGLAKGHVNIIIATQAILSNTIEFHDLGLLIVDEEQHFGVKQKEKLKTLKKDVHVLTLTATPIPRTLQLALSGVRELSLITTPPIDRLAVTTFVLPYDPLTVREAILREYHRGGQIFYISPRLEDLYVLNENLHNLVPEIKIAIAHGQLPAKQLEAVITSFYDRSYDLLLSTNIVESGIDIPTVNTLIVHRADLFGLSQLYQLRGRVGRSKVQSYAYLTLPTDRSVSEKAQKRLQVMQSLDTLGAGFQLASHDMDIRGAGSIVGEEQSGHIREVGVELYQTLLQEAIIMARAEQANNEAASGCEDKNFTPQLNLGIAVLIPESYIKDLGIRLELYRRLAHLETSDQIEEFTAELIDRFGKFPVEVKNLLIVIGLKNLCRKAGIEKLDVGSKGLVITFKDNQFSKPDKLMNFLQSKNVNQIAQVKIRPDHKVAFICEWSNEIVKMQSVIQIIKAIVNLV